MLSDEAIDEAGRRLFEAERSRRQMGQLSREFPDITVADAYRIQTAFVGRKIQNGATMRGHKIGLTSRAMQSSLGIDEPDFGVLLDDMFFTDGADIPTERFIATRIEVELAFVLGRPLAGPNVTIFDVLGATEFVTPALEILDTRIERVDRDAGSTRKIFDTIADNAANAGVVLGGRPFRPLDVDIRWISAICFKNAVVEETGVAAGVLNHPANGVAWLANTLAAHGGALSAGEIVLAGSFTRAIEARRGDVFHADYGPFGTVSCRFV